jgi:hypothetical protein
LATTFYATNVRYTTKKTYSKQNHPTKKTTMVELVAGLAAQLWCFEPPHPWETLQEGLVEGVLQGVLFIQ